MLVTEQHVLEHLTVRLVADRAEQDRFDQLIEEQHFLRTVPLVGEHLRYVVSYGGEWLTLAAWSAAALLLKARDQFIGWSEEQRRARLPLLANNARLLVLPECHYPNLVSRFMKIMLARLSADWQERWGHPLAAVETFVDPQLYQGTAYNGKRLEPAGPDGGFPAQRGGFGPVCGHAVAEAVARAELSSLSQNGPGALSQSHLFPASAHAGGRAGGATGLAGLAGQSPGRQPRPNPDRRWQGPAVRRAGRGQCRPWPGPLAGQRACASGQQRDSGGAHLAATAGSARQAGVQRRRPHSNPDPATVLFEGGGIS